MHFIVGLLAASLFIAISLEEAIYEKTSRWDYCNCRWSEWRSWSECSAQCYGTRVRTRKVWLTNNDGCDEFEDCASDNSDIETCNKVCHNGGVYSSGYPCKCRRGWKGRCCDRVVTCGWPGNIAHGQVHGSNYNYGNTVRYSCNRNYRRIGYYKQTCQDDGIWSGTKPTCVLNTCASNPCQNSGTCVEGFNQFTCRCLPGYNGSRCENDIQPPVFENCPRSFTAHATNKTLNVTWETPTASDPLGHNVTVFTNYPEGSAEFPWDDFTVQYVATKKFNGLQSECTFVISVRPTPCPELRVPGNGSKVCNGWKTDMASLCLVFCAGDRSLPLGSDHRQWWVCGAHGAWIPSSPLPDCAVRPSVENGEDKLDVAEYRYTSCATDGARMKNTYVEKLKQSEFRYLCEQNENDCVPENVHLECSQ